MKERMGPAREVQMTRYQIAVYGPDERLVWRKDLTDEDVAALMPAIASTGGPDMLSGCWSLDAFFEDYESDK